MERIKKTLIIVISCIMLLLFVNYCRTIIIIKNGEIENYDKNR